jgi:transcriptional regulator
MRAMYVPAHFDESRTEVLHELIHTHPLGVLVTLGSRGLEANHIPWEIDPTAGPMGTLRGHVARGNAVWRDTSPDVEALVIFQGPQAYVTPSWLAAKAETGKVVPTYNYVVVHAYGPLTVIDDQAWLLGLVTRLTDRFESAREAPWKVTDAPSDYVENLLGAIVGLEIPLTRLLGKWKVSQNRNAADREGLARGLRADSGVDAPAMARLVEGHPRA